jgi:peroxiredoxin
LKNALLKAAIPAICMIAGAAAHAQHPFTISGKLAKDKQGTIILRYEDAGNYVTDSVQVTNGVFVFKGKLGDPSKASLVLEIAHAGAPSMQRAMNADWKDFYLEEGTVVLNSNSDLRSAVVKGGKTQAAYAVLSAQHKVIDEQLSVIGARAFEYKTVMNDTGMQGIQRRSRPLAQQKKVLDSAFIKEHPDNYLSFELLFKRRDGIIDLAQVEPAFNQLSAVVRNTDAGKKLAARIAMARKVSAGQPAIDFTLPDTLGKPVSLSALKGKYVVLCFWSATYYNVPSQLFALNRVQKQFANKNLVVVGVSFDKEVQRWKNALSENFVRWTNVLDPDGFDKRGNSVSTLTRDYDLSISSVPQCCVIGPDGVILARALYPDNNLATTVGKLMGQ